MFSSRVNPSPTRTSIKEANDHLQLLHNKVKELETTVKEQAELLIEKDQLLQSRLQEVSKSKDGEIMQLHQIIASKEERIKKLETLIAEKEIQYEQLGQKFLIVEEIASFTPTLEKLLTSLKKLGSSKIKHNPSTKLKTKLRTHLTKTRYISSSEGPHHNENHIQDGHPISCQNSSDLRIARSFNINSNFSEDEGDTMEIL